MKKIIYRTILIFLISLVSFIGYFSTIGFETKKFNNQINDKLKEKNKDLDLKLSKIKLILNPFKFEINAKTFGTKLKHKDKALDFEYIQTKISLKSLIENEFSLINFKASTKSLEIKNFISFIQSLNNSAELFIFKKLIKNGYLIADISFNFDEKGNLKNDFKIKGFVTDTKINFIQKYEVKNLNFIFDLNKENLELQDLKLSFNNFKLFSKELNIKKINNKFKFEGLIENKDLILNNEEINLFIKPYFPAIDIKKIRFNSKNKFSFKLNKKFEFSDFKIESKINVKNFLISNNLKLKKLFPEIKESIIFSDHKLRLIYNKNNLDINGKGNILLQNQKDKIHYSVSLEDKTYKFDTTLDIKENPLDINFLNYKKDKNNEAKISVKGHKKTNHQIKFDSISFEEKNNKIIIKNLILNKNFKIIDLKSASFDFRDEKNNLNKFKILNKDKKFYLKGQILNADNLIEHLLNNNDDSSKLLNKNFKVFVDIDKILLDEKYNLKNLEGHFSVEDQEITNAKLVGFFSDNKRLTYTVKTTSNKKITTLFSDEAETLVNRYKFINGFKGGVLDFYSSRDNFKKESFSKLKIYDFKLKKLPALTKLLTLASLQGIVDTLSGEGIGFNEFEMTFRNKKNTIMIEEIYAIGPAISILMDGYIEKNKLVSLRGSLVPATTINKVISTIPILGKILVGSKTGEGVFGVSFKIKGPPKKMETTVNPIKTLTPRFITRTLEKIKKN